MRKIAVISLSGGMDSTALLIRLLAEHYTVYGVSINYGQKHLIELERLQKNISYLKREGYELAGYTVLDLSQIGEMFQSSLLKGGSEIPSGHYSEENMKSTVVPNRNAIFSSIIYGYALSISEKEECPVEIFLGVHSGDHEIYPDCRPEFYFELENAFKTGNWGSENVSFKLPYISGNKTTILKDCYNNCQYPLNLNFDEIMRNTNTSYNPDQFGRSSGISGSDIERIEAFLNIGRVDPVEYVNGWAWSVRHACGILNRPVPIPYV